MIRDALRVMAEAHIEMGEPLPTPNSKAKDKKAMFSGKDPRQHPRADGGAVVKRRK